MSLDQFTARLINARHEKRLTQAELAGALGVTAQAVSRWERGSSYPDLPMLDAMSAILDCSIDYLLQYKEAHDPFAETETYKRNEIIKSLILKEKLTLAFGLKLLPMIQEESAAHFDQLQKMRRILANGCGVYVPQIRICDTARLGDYEYEIQIDGKKIESGEAYYPLEFFVNRHKEADELEVIEPLWKLPGIWKESTEQDKSDVNAFSFIITHLQIVIMENYDLIINRQIVADLVDIVRSKYPAVVSGIIPEKISYAYLQKVLTGLLRKHYAINNMVKIIELIEDNQEACPDVASMVDLIAEAMGESDIITNFFRG
jgi:flagellar biosynthesis component FlhA